MRRLDKRGVCEGTVVRIETQTTRGEAEMMSRLARQHDDPTPSGYPVHAGSFLGILHSANLPSLDQEGWMRLRAFIAALGGVRACVAARAARRREL